MNSKDIHETVNSYQNFPPEYGSLGLTNHLPMAQFALHRLEGRASDLERFTNSYINDHDLRPASFSTGVSLNERNWRDYLGKRQCFADYRSFFAAELNILGRDGFVKFYFNALFRGISSAAYHSLIRLAYGVDSDNDEEILSGMSYLADAYLELHGPLPGWSDHASPLKDQMNYVSAELSSGRLTLPPLEGIIFQKMDIVSQPSVLARVSEKIMIPTGSALEDFSDLAIRLYLHSRDFTALHTVTSCHASRIMMPYVEDQSSYLSYLYQALVAAYLTIDAPRIAEYETSLTTSEKLIERIKSAARKSNDDHDIKLTYTALEEHRIYENALYLKAATELYPELQPV